MRRKGRQRIDTDGRGLVCAGAWCGAASGEMRGVFEVFASLRMTPFFRLAAKVSLDRFPAVDFVGGFGLRGGDVFNDDAADAVTGHLGDLVAATALLEGLAYGGDVAEVR
jgi:hypothetical protein